MPLKMRLSRGGSKKRPFYHIVVADSRYPRDGRYIEKVGSYNPMLPRESEQRVVLKNERIQHWIKMGAQATERVALFLGKAGLAEMPKQTNRPSQSAPKAKAQERLKEQEAARQAAIDAAEEAKKSAEEAANAPAPEPEAAPADVSAEASAQVEESAADTTPVEETTEAPASDDAAA